MTTIERIGTITIAQHGAVFIVIDRAAPSVETYHSERDARDAALERADLVDAFAYTVH
jgi:hypothetical protein